jgi:hypothetical protein
LDERQATFTRPLLIVANDRHKDMTKLVSALRARDQQLGIAVSLEDVA